MKILSIGYTSVDAGGPYNVAENHQSVLQKNNFLVDVSSFALNNTIKNIFFNKKELIEYLNSYDLVHFHNIFSVSNALISSLLYQIHVPYIISLHGNLNYWSLKQSKLRKKLFLYLFSSFIKNSRGIHILNDHEKTEVSKIINIKNSRLFKLQNCIDVSKYKINKIKKKEFTVLFFGRLNYKKGIFRLLDIIKKIDDDNIKNIKFLFVGPKDLEIFNEFKNKIKSLKIEKIIEIRDVAKTIEEKKNVFKESDIFILPSEDEADSVAVKEALSFGLPVIISKNCKFDYNGDDKEFIKIIKNNDVSEYGQAIKNFYENKEKIHNFSEAAHSFAVDNFSLARIEDVLPEIYYDCLTYSYECENWYK